MGNDGGSIPSRGELVKTKGAPKKVLETATANNDFAWKYCVLSRAPLAQPMTSDAYGRLYNKESVIQYVLDKSAFGDVSRDMSHITSMRDVVDLKIGTSDGKYICEVTRRDMNGLTKFVYLSTCGHCFAAEALRNVKSTDCLICSKPYSLDDVIPLNPPPTEIERLQARLERLESAGLTHSGATMKKRKRSKKADAASEPDKVKLVKTITNKESAETSSHSATFQSLFHKTGEKPGQDGFMTRGTSSRVG